MQRGTAHFRPFGPHAGVGRSSVWSVRAAPGGGPILDFCRGGSQTANESTVIVKSLRVEAVHQNFVYGREAKRADVTRKGRDNRVTTAGEVPTPARAVPVSALIKGGDGRVRRLCRGLRAMAFAVTAVITEGRSAIVFGRHTAVSSCMASGRGSGRSEKGRAPKIQPKVEGRTAIASCSSATPTLGRGPNGRGGV